MTSARNTSQTPGFSQIKKQNLYEDGFSLNLSKLERQYISQKNYVLTEKAPKKVLENENCPPVFLFGQTSTLNAQTVGYQSRCITGLIRSVFTDMTDLQSQKPSVFDQNLNLSVWYDFLLQDFFLET